MKQRRFLLPPALILLLWFLPLDQVVQLRTAPETAKTLKLRAPAGAS